MSRPFQIRPQNRNFAENAPLPPPLLDGSILKHVAIDIHAAGFVIGRGGSNITDIGRHTGTTIRKVRENLEYAIFEVKGNRDNVSTAAQLLEDAARKKVERNGNGNARMLADQLVTPQHAVGYVLRNGGRFLAAIEQRTGTKIRAPPRNASPPVHFIIDGTSLAAIDEAKSLLVAEIANADPSRASSGSLVDLIAAPLQAMMNKAKSSGHIKEINLLLLGKSGVGKSTFVNGLLNYLRFATLDEAAKGPMWAMKMHHFTYLDDGNRQDVIVYPEGCQNDTNERHGTGESVTQQPRTYVLPITDRLHVKLIDTPGIGDTKGETQDNKNFRMIMDHLAGYKEIHGILILIKANDNRNDLMFKYCLNGILEQLNRSAIKNILFCMTNSAGGQPGDAYRILQDILRPHGVEVGLKVNTFCFENGAIRYLAEKQNGVVHNKGQTDDANKSWTISSKSTGELFHTISSLQPHLTEDTMTINRARIMISTLTEPLVDVSTKIELNINRLKETELKIRANPTQLADLFKVQHIGIERIQLDYPRTVCASPKCVTVEKGETVYSQVCHEHCYLQGIPTGCYPQEGLRLCAAMDRSNSAATKCKKCSCDYSTHLHICYEIRRRYTSLKIGSPSSVDEACRQIRAEITRYEASRERFAEASAKLIHFLMENAIVPYNDAVEEYLGHLIKLEKTLIQTRKKDSSDDLNALENALNAHKERKARFEAVLKARRNGINAQHELYKVNVTDVDLNEVERIFKELKTDEFFGQDFARLYDMKATAEHKGGEEGFNKVVIACNLGDRFQRQSFRPPRNGRNRQQHF